MFTQTEKIATGQIPLHNDGVRVLFTTLSPQVCVGVTKPYVYGQSKFALRPMVWGE